MFFYLGYLVEGKVEVKICITVEVLRGWQPSEEKEGRLNVFWLTIEGLGVFDIARRLRRVENLKKHV